MPEVLVGLLGSEDLLDNVEEGADLGRLGEYLLAVLLCDLGATLL